MMVGMARSKATIWPALVALIAALAADRLAPAGWAIVSAGLAGAAAAYLQHGDDAERGNDSGH